MFIHVNKIILLYSVLVKNLQISLWCPVQFARSADEFEAGGFPFEHWPFDHHLMLGLLVFLYLYEYFVFVFSYFSIVLLYLEVGGFKHGGLTSS